MTDSHKLDFMSFYVRQANRAAQDLRYLNRRLPYGDLEALRDAKRWIDEALAVAESFETEAERERLDSETA